MVSGASGDMLTHGNEEEGRTGFMRPWETPVNRFDPNCFFGVSAKSHDGVKIIGWGGLSAEAESHRRSLMRRSWEKCREFQACQYLKQGRGMTGCLKKGHKNDGASRD